MADVHKGSMELAHGKELENNSIPEDTLERSANNITWTEEEEKALVRKIDLFLLPCIWFMYLLSYMDRTK
jgi:hypothetical protein